MKIKDVLQRDPATHPLVNHGQARISDKSTDREIAELRGELMTFVCEGQYADGIQRIVGSYLASASQTSQKAAWVSGFFGSGKSHVLKMLCHLWQDTRFADGATARGLVPAMPDELRSLLRELDTAGRRAGGLLAAAGSLPGGTTDQVRLTILSVLLRGVGLPDQYPQARFVLWLQEQDYFERVKAAVERAGKAWMSEINNLYVSGPITRALLECDAHFAPSEADARKTLREQFPLRTTDITTAEFLTTFKAALRLAGRGERLPCTALVLDEVQQYIGDSHDRSTLVTEVAEAISKQLDSHVIVVGAGQSALTEMPRLQKLMDRFTIRVPLSDADVETVTRKVLLQKKPAAIAEVRATLEAHGGEVSRQLQGTRIAHTPADDAIAIDDYPLLPVRRRFWEHCFRQVDAAGTHSQLRSQLRIIHDALARVADGPLGTLVPGDELFEALAPEMVNTGVLLREINERIINLARDGSEDGKLARRICGLVFLIGKLSRDAGADIGVRATKEHIADLLVDDLRADNGRLRAAVESTLQALAGVGVLMQIGEEYRLQTREGAEWDREFRNRQTKLANNDADIQIRRDQLLYAEVDRIVRGIRLIQGAAKEPRSLVVSRDQKPPVTTGDSIPVWARDGWSSSEKDLVDAARAAGGDSPTIFVFLPRQAADDLQKWIVEAEAAQQTIHAKDVPTTPEGVEARQSMEGRRDIAVKQRDDVVKEIAGNAKVFQGGGTELLSLALEERVGEAASASLIRLFPRFKEADSAAWEPAIKRARDGADQPFQPLGHTGPTEQHPVCQQVLATIGAGKNGADVRKALRASPFGWPQDAIDAALIALHRAQHVSATLNGAPVGPGQLDQNRISRAEFRVERVTLSVPDRLVIRGLFQSVGTSCRAGEESAKAPEFVQKLLALAAGAGGAPPLPPVPPTADIDDLARLVGNDQLAAIRDRAADIKNRIEGWTKTRSLIEARWPSWQTAERLARHAAGVPGASETLAQVEAIRRERLLLQPIDPVAPLRAALTEMLRNAVLEAHAAHETALASGLKMLEAGDAWQRLSEADRSAILAEVGLARPGAVDVSSDSALLETLDARSLPARQAEADAVAGRVQRAIELAAKRLEPHVQFLSVERATLRTEGDVRGWTARQQERLLEAVRVGPVLIQ